MKRQRVSLLAGGLMLLAGVGPLGGEPAATLTIVDAGRPRATIVLPADPADGEEQAAAELVEHLRLISGATLAVSRGDAPADGPAIRLGAAAEPSAPAAAAGDNPSAFVLAVDEQGVSVSGVTAEGTLFGVYELLEQLGVRWYHPGDLGRVTPRADTLVLAHQRTIQSPSMEYRQLMNLGNDPWQHRVRLGGRPLVTGAHGIQPFRRNRALFESHPEYFALIDGQRHFRQVCVSQPGAVALAVDWIRDRHRPTSERLDLGMGPNDGHGYCECAGCRALDGDVPDPSYALVSVTGRYIWFLNQVLEALEDDYPNLHLAWYVYARHMMPPPPGLQPHPRIIHVLAPITLDRVRGMDNPYGPDRHILRWLIEQWRAAGPNEIYYRGYYYNLACPQFPFSQLDRIINETPAFHEEGIRVMRVETRLAWSTQTPALYLAARLMWDVETDAAALLEEFYRLFYGPAQAAMKSYHETLEAAFRDTPYYTGSGYLYLPIFLGQPRREHLRGALAAAAAAAGGDPDPAYAARVRSVRLAWERLEVFLDMISARNDFDFARAYALIGEFEKLTDQLTGTVLSGEGERETDAMRLLPWRERTANPRNMFNRFFAETIRAGYVRSGPLGEMVAALPDEWSFIQDPVRVGKMSGYHRPGPLGGGWQPLKTTSRSWSDQGMHHYKGLPAWYRASVEIPAAFAGRPLYLWFGGVDDVAHVWINGRFVGTSRAPEGGLPGTPGSFQPFDMPATDAVRYGEVNWVAVKIENERIVERGTGGIVAPVMFWSPRDPGWQPE